MSEQLTEEQVAVLNALREQEMEYCLLLRSIQTALHNEPPDLAIIGEMLEQALRGAALEPALASNQWVRAADRLPPINTEVLIVFRGCSLPATGQYTGSPLDHDGWCYPSENSGDGTDWTVTHWQPLPEGPAQEENEDE